MLVFSILYRIYLFTLTCCVVVIGRTEKRQNLPACFLKYLYCGHLTPLLLAIFLADLTCSLLFFLFFLKKEKQKPLSSLQLKGCLNSRCIEFV